jgi:S-adenosylmethionine:tRNA ribosyltransferase-isomerase
MPSNDQVFLEYDLPEELIAQEPAKERDRARLLVLQRRDSKLTHSVFADLPELLRPGDLLVLNDTKVVPARLLGRRLKTQGKWEGLFLREYSDGCWEMLCQTGGRLVEGESIAVEPGPLELLLVAKSSSGSWHARPSLPGPAAELLHKHGHVPLPPYIRKGRSLPDDEIRYQTVYAQHPGSVAAPTAGFHFTPDLLELLHEHGIEHAFVTLHVGLGTFQGIQQADYRDHRMHSEWGSVSAETACSIASCRERGSRVVAVGTTTARVLETVAAGGPIRAWSGETDLFIYPPYRFRAIDALITNFHLPRTSLLLLVQALAGVELTRAAYELAVREKYRFFSYGDAMLIF